MKTFVASLIASGHPVEDYCAEKGAYVVSYAPAYDDLPTFHYIENKGKAAWNAESMRAIVKAAMKNPLYLPLTKRRRNGLRSKRQYPTLSRTTKAAPLIM